MKRADIVAMILGGTVLSFPRMIITLEVYSAETMMALGNFSKRLSSLSFIHFTT